MSNLTYFAGATARVETSDQGFYGGEADIVTSQGRLVADAAGYAAGAVLAQNADGTYRKYVAADGLGRAVAVLAYDIPIERVDPDKHEAIFIGGVFNMERLVWDAAITTRAARIAAFSGTNIHAQMLYPPKADPLSA